jgi:hypothetical protein
VAVFIRHPSGQQGAGRRRGVDPADQFPRWLTIGTQPPQNTGATRIEHHFRTFSDRGAADFSCSALRARMPPPYSANLPSSVGQPFSAAHFSGHCFRLIPASGSFAASAFPVPPLHHWVPSHKAAARFGSRSPRFWVPQENGARKRRKFSHVLPQFYNSRRVRWF